MIDLILAILALALVGIQDSFLDAIFSDTDGQ